MYNTYRKWNPKTVATDVQLYHRVKLSFTNGEPLLQQTAHFFSFKHTIECIIEARLFKSVYPTVKWERKKFAKFLIV